LPALRHSVSANQLRRAVGRGRRARALVRSQHATDARRALVPVRPGPQRRRLPIGTYLVVSRRWREVVWLGIPVIAWITWFLLERNAIAFRGSEPTIASAIDFGALGIAATLGFGGGLLLSAAHAALLAGAFPWRLTPVAWGAIVGLAATFVALGLVREGFSGPESSRYLYLGAPFLTMTIAELASTARRPILARTVLASGILVGATLLVVNGLVWPTEVAAARANGFDIVPAGVCR